MITVFENKSQISFYREGGITKMIRSKAEPSFQGTSKQVIAYLKGLGLGVSVEVRHSRGARSCLNKPALWEAVKGYS